MKNLIVRLRREPVAVRGFVAATLSLLVAGGVVDTGASTEYELVALGLINAFLFKGARDKVEPVRPSQYVVR